MARRLSVGAFLLVGTLLVVSTTGFAQQMGGGGMGGPGSGGPGGDGMWGPPNNQWPPNDGNWNDGRQDRRDDRRDRRDFRRDYPYMNSSVSAAWYQRPYPTHLDFFRLRYGATVGNDNGNTCSPYPAYYGPYYTGSATAGYGGPGGPEMPAVRYFSGPGPGTVEYPASVTLPDGTVEEAMPVDQPVAKPQDSALPPPAKK
jgi:hypothetical protein